MNNIQPSLFSEKELARMISPTLSKKRNHAEWELRKRRLGMAEGQLTPLPKEKVKRYVKICLTRVKGDGFMVNL